MEVLIWPSLWSKHQIKCERESFQYYHELLEPWLVKHRSITLETGIKEKYGLKKVLRLRTQLIEYATFRKSNYIKPVIYHIGYKHYVQQ